MFILLSALSLVSAEESNHGAAVGVGTLGVTASYIYAANKDCAVSVRYHVLPVPEAEKTSEMIGADIGPYMDTTNLGGNASVLLHYHPLKRENELGKSVFWCGLQYDDN